jgi:predicted nucleic acid-binding protein
MYLLGTDVLSELRKRKRDANVMTWIAAVPPADVFLSTVTIFEIELGIERQLSGDPAFAKHLAVWLDATLRLYGERVLPLTVSIARRWGRLSAQIGDKTLDLAIAATALEHRLTVVTRNAAHHAPTGVDVLNPFERRPGRR